MSSHSFSTVTAPTVHKAFQWLLESGIQVRSQDPKTEGGVCSWYDLKTKSYPFIYAEITGYAVNAFLFYYRRTQNEKHLSAAIRAGQWLIENRDATTELVLTRQWLSNTSEAYYDDCFFVFDQWVIVYGLANLSAVSGEKRFLNAAVSIADFLLRHTKKPDGFFEPLYDCKEKKSKAFNDKWSRQSGSFHAKALMSLALLFKLTGAAVYRKAADQLLTKTLSIQTSDGRFITQDNEQNTHLHPFIYTLEGLVSYGLSDNRAVVWPAVERGMKWILERQNPDGSLYCFFRNGRFQPSIRVDTLAQAIRIGTVCLSRGLLTGFENALDRLRTKMNSYQMTEGPQTGGFLYGTEENGAVHEHVNAWVTMFAAQAMCIQDELRNSQAPYDMSFFI